MGKTTVIIGGGAAGFFCAVNLARMVPDMKVVILEKTSKLLSKVRVSGGGRCNVTHDCTEISEMANRYPRGKNFVRKAFHSFFSLDTIKWFEERGVKLKTEKDGRMFPVTNSSETIINCLMREADQYQVEIIQQASVQSLLEENERWLISYQKSEQQKTILADHVVVATGGYPKKEQYAWLESTAHEIIEPVPSLFTFNAPNDPIIKLMGIAVEDAEVRIPSLKAKERGPVLITHWGISGPAVIKLSAWLARDLYENEYKALALINWLPDFNEQTFREFIHQYRNEHGSEAVGGKSPFGLPNRLWEYLTNKAGVKGESWATLPAATQNKLISLLVSYPLEMAGKTTFKEEFVTAGGISTKEVNPDSMESRKKPNLYFAGEVLDIDGVTGGFNFQHAWTSGFKAAVHIAGKNVS